MKILKESKKLNRIDEDMFKVTSKALKGHDNHVYINARDEKSALKKLHGYTSKDGREHVTHEVINPYHSLSKETIRNRFITADDDSLEVELIPSSYDYDDETLLQQHFTRTAFSTADILRTRHKALVKNIYKEAPVALHHDKKHEAIFDCIGIFTPYPESEPDDELAIEVHKLLEQLNNVNWRGSKEYIISELHRYWETDSKFNKSEFELIIRRK